MNLAHVLTGDQAGVCVPVILNNTDSVELPPHSPCEITGAYAMPDVGDRRWNDRIALTVQRFTNGNSLAIAASADFRIPAGKTGPGFTGTLLPIDQAGTIGTQFRPTKDAFTLTSGAGPLLLMDTGTPSLFQLNSSQMIYGFVLTASESSGTAVGNLIDPLTDAVIKTEETLQDPFGFISGAASGQQGFALYVKDKWVVLGGGTGGGGGSGSALPVVAFTLTADMSSGSAAATINVAYGAVLSGSITVTDPQDLFVFAKSGAKGFAIKSGATYVAIQCDQLAIQLKGTLATFPSSSPSFGLKPTTDGYIASGYTALTTAPFGQLPVDLDASAIPNPLGLMGFPGDEAVLQFTKATGSYFFLAVEKMATRVKGSVTADFNDADTTVTIDGITGLNGKPPSSPLTVYNTHGWTGIDNAIIRAEFNPVLQVYEMYQMDC